MIQEPPFAIQLEPTEGCTLACSFCALQSIRDNGADFATGTHGKRSDPYFFMSLDTVRRVASEVKRLGWNPRFEFAMHGEPTVNTALHVMIRIVRERLPRAYIMVTTNGAGVTKPEHLKALFDAGLNTLAIDNYKHASYVARIKPWLRDTCAALGIATHRYPRDIEGNPHQRNAGKRVVVVDDISDNTSGTHQLTNQGGNSGETIEMSERCAKPFRELSVRHDGNVALCCDDWPGHYKIGNVHAMKLDELWNSPRFEAARRYLYRGQRATLRPCEGCNVRTHRNGLLPDKKGRLDMPAPDDDSARWVALAQAGAPYSKRVR